jgi:hypothetical protein
LPGYRQAPVFVKQVVRRFHAASLISGALVSFSGFNQTGPAGCQFRVFPDQHHLEGAWKEQLLSAHLEKVEAQIRDELTLQEMPENLMADVEAILKEDPSQSWDQAVREVAGRTLV